MKPLVLLVPCLFASLLSAAAQAPTPAILALKPLVDVWRTCALDKGKSFMRSGESAETIAKVALYECREQRQTVADALYRTMPNGAVDTVVRLEADIKDLMVSIIVQARSK